MEVRECALSFVDGVEVGEGGGCVGESLALVDAVGVAEVLYVVEVLLKGGDVVGCVFVEEKGGGFGVVFGDASIKEIINSRCSCSCSICSRCSNRRRRRRGGRR